MERLSSGKFRFIYAADSRYAPEGDALVVADALDKAIFFVLGCSDLIMAADHRPLLEILGDRSIDVITNTRLMNTKENTLRYRFRFSAERWSRGKAPDCQSRGRWFNPTCRFET